MLQVEIAQETAEYTLRVGDRLVFRHEAEEIVLTREQPVAVRRISLR
jgi:alpha,alpha-trehalose phosphorylase